MKSWNLAEISVKSWNQFRNLKISKSRTGLYSVADPSGLLDRDHIRPRGPQLIFLDADFSSLSISCGLYVLYKAARG